MAEIQAFLKDQTLPEDREGSKRISRISKRYVLVEGALYRRGANDLDYLEERRRRAALRAARY